MCKESLDNTEYKVNLMFHIGVTNVNLTLKVSFPWKMMSYLNRFHKAPWWLKTQENAGEDHLILFTQFINLIHYDRNYVRMLYTTLGNPATQRLWSGTVRLRPVVIWVISAFVLKKSFFIGFCAFLKTFFLNINLKIQKSISVCAFGDGLTS